MKSIRATGMGHMGGRPSPNMILAEVLGGSVDLRSGACVGHWQLFDPRNDGEPVEEAENRQAAAKAMCRTCPVLAECSDWLDSLPKSRRPSGVVAGEYIRPLTERSPRGKAS